MKPAKTGRARRARSLSLCLSQSSAMASRSPEPSELRLLGHGRVGEHHGARRPSAAARRFPTEGERRPSRQMKSEKNPPPFGNFSRVTTDMNQHLTQHLTHRSHARTTAESRSAGLQLAARLPVRTRPNVPGVPFLSFSLRTASPRSQFSPNTLNSILSTAPQMQQPEQ